MTRGVILFNAGRKLLVRAAVCLSTLRRHWTGPVTLLVDRNELRTDDSPHIRAMCRHWAVDFSPVKFETGEGRNRAFLNKCLLHTVTPYSVSLLIDLDCVAQGDISPMFAAAERAEFAVCRFADWTVRGKIAKRIANWNGILPASVMSAAAEYPAAINTGVFAFRRDAQLMRYWWDYAVRGRESWIPDETCCQAMLAAYPHELMSARFNASCRYGKELDSAAIIHYHGSKHCRFRENTDEFLFDAARWYEAFEEIRHLPFVERFIFSDRQLRKNLPTWDAIRSD